MCQFSSESDADASGKSTKAGSPPTLLSHSR
jgi:hypothetical protein